MVRIGVVLMGQLKCCCQECPFDLEDLPDATITGWTAGSWAFTEGTCCAVIAFSPVSCAATFVDGGFLDYNSETTTFTCKNYVLLYNQTTASATYEDGVIYPPAVYCPPCNDPFVCGERLFEQQLDVATRFGLLYAPHEIRVSICSQFVECPGEERVRKYIVRSTYYYKAKTYIKKYSWTSTRDEVTAGGCCTGTEDNSDYQPEPDFESESFWGIDFDCDEIADGTLFSFTRYKVLDALPSGVLSFTNDDCRLCPDDTEEECVTEICFESEGVSDPTNGGVTIQCADLEVRTISCQVPSFQNRCDGLYYFIDPAQPELGIQCAPRPPVPRPTPATCGPFNYTTKGIFAVSDPTAIVCDEASCSAGGVYDDCLVSGICPDPSVLLSYFWSDTTLLTFINTCTGGTDAEACIPAPSWSVTFT